MDIDGAQLRAFVIVADERHFGRAAGQLFITQQALSKRIARLESLLGVRLLDRDRNGVSPTAAGRSFLQHARPALDEMDAAVAAVGAGSRGLTIDVLDEHLALLPCVREVNELTDEQRLTAVMRQDAQSAFGVLRNGSADIALGRPGSEQDWPADIRGVPVLAEPIRLLVPSGHRLDRRAGVRMEELAGQPLWFPTVGAPGEWTGLLTELVDDFGLTVDRVGSTFGFSYWMGLVAQGSAPPSLIGAGMQLPTGIEVSVVPIVHPVPVFWWWAMWRRRLPAIVIEPFLRALRAALPAGLDERLPGGDNGWVPVRDRAFDRAG